MNINPYGGLKINTSLKFQEKYKPINYIRKRCLVVKIFLTPFLLTLIDIDVLRDCHNYSISLKVCSCCALEASKSLIEVRNSGRLF